MREVLFVSKPVAPPWTDSNKNLVRDLARGLTRYRPRVLTPADSPLAGVTSERVYAQAGLYAPSRAANARVFARLALGPSVALWHFFFAPNPVTLVAGRAVALAKRMQHRTIHTIASAPDSLEAVVSQLFAKRVVVLSSHTRRRLDSVGVQCTVIPPALTVPSVLPEQIQAMRDRYALHEPYVLYAGDLEFGNGAQTFIRAAAADRSRLHVIAARPKTLAARDAQERLKREAIALGARVEWLGEIQDIHAVIAGASVLSLVTDTLHAKMDWPLVLLESLVLGVPCVVGESSAAEELSASGACEAIRNGDPQALMYAHRAWSERTEPIVARTAEAAQWVRRTCDPSVIASQYETLYDELVHAG
ncbi:MAG: glycosyltransferase [Deltaproteobacteria bacterium]|nr:glycosyltransferase [Deltaproteobacteria bacterium]